MTVDNAIVCIRRASHFPVCNTKDIAVKNIRIRYGIVGENGL